MERLFYLSLTGMAVLWVATYVFSKAERRVAKHIVFFIGTLIVSPLFAFALSALMLSATYRDIDHPVISVVPVFVIGMTVPSAFVIWFAGYGAAKGLSFLMRKRVKA
jgi:xanthine/uracil permease